MRDPIEALRDALAREVGGIALVWSPLDMGVRDWLVCQLEGLAPERNPIVVKTVEEALTYPSRLALLVPQNEREVVLDLDASRDRIRSEETPRTQPIVLFLFRDGDGSKALSAASSLNSVIKGNDPDPEALAEIDVPGERMAFQKRTGMPPEAWLHSWEDGARERDAEAYALASWAKLLERP